jgi:hypothetical protein
MTHPFDLFLPDYVETIKQHADAERLQAAAPYLLSIVLDLYNSHNICEYCDYRMGCCGIGKEMKDIEDGVLPPDCLYKQCDEIIRYSYGES